MNKLHVRNLKGEILRNAFDHDEITVISGYISPIMVNEIKEVFKKSTIVYGLYGRIGIQSNLHNALINITPTRHNKLNLLYSNYDTHAKIYILKNKGITNKIYIGSANFTANGLCGKDYQEILYEADDIDINDVDEFEEFILNSSVDCKSIILDQKTNSSSKIPSADNPYSVLMPLYLVKGPLKEKYVPLKSGLNWGNQKGHTRINSPMESYIKISKDHIENYPIIFPPITLERTTTDGKKNRKNDAIEIIWDDKVVMKCIMSGIGITRNGRTYPKQITSTDSELGNSELGSYIRKRMGLDPNSIIEYKDLQKYGRDTIKLTFITDGVYAADFSV